MWKRKLSDELVLQKQTSTLWGKNMLATAPLKLDTRKQLGECVMCCQLYCKPRKHKDSCDQINSLSLKVNLVNIIQNACTDNVSPFSPFRRFLGRIDVSYHDELFV